MTFDEMLDRGPPLPLRKFYDLDWRPIAGTRNFHCNTGDDLFLALLLEGETDKFLIYRDGKPLLGRDNQSMTLSRNLLHMAGMYVEVKNNGREPYWKGHAPRYEDDY